MFLSNAGVLQVFGVNDHESARLVSDLLGQELLVELEHVDHPPRRARARARQGAIDEDHDRRADQRRPGGRLQLAQAVTDKQKGRKRNIKNDNLGMEFEEFLVEAFTNMLAVCKGAIYACMSSSELDTLQRAFRTEIGRAHV